MSRDERNRDLESRPRRSIVATAARSLVHNPSVTPTAPALAAPAPAAPTTASCRTGRDRGHDPVTGRRAGTVTPGRGQRSTCANALVSNLSRGALPASYSHACSLNNEDNVAVQEPVRPRRRTVAVAGKSSLAGP
jgi:hypothetical protein